MKTPRLHINEWSFGPDFANGTISIKRHDRIGALDPFYYRRELNFVPDAHRLSTLKKDDLLIFYYNDLPIHLMKYDEDTWRVGCNGWEQAGAHLDVWTVSMPDD